MQYLMTMKSDLGDKLLPASFAGGDELGRLFSYQLKMRSESDDIDLRSLLGSSITVTYEEEGYTRRFNGIVAEVSQAGFANFQGRRYVEFLATLVPKPWLLLHKVDCRIYLNQSVPDIVKTVLAEIGYSDVKLNLAADYPPREYCVQYREDYFNFISRLMEQEGIYYFFQHADGVHTMVLADSLGAHSTTPGFAELPYLPETGSSGPTHEVAIAEFSAARSVQTTKYSLTDYDPLKPKASLLGAASVSNADDNHPVAGMESFDYPGKHATRAAGEHYAQVRAEAINVAQSQVSGATAACGLLTGALFTLDGFPQKSLNQEYLVVGSTVQIANPEYGADAVVTGERFQCSFTAIRSHQPFRTMPTADKPVVVGIQTAIVTGSETAEDIAVDEHGRVQVNFHWAMPGRPNAHCSCPVRVASSWAGKGWGAVSYPRVGQEVVVSFIEGDPDRPLIVGSVYNADNTPPYTLPDDKTQSGIKSRSLLGGNDDYNELRLEDKQGSEDFFIHAQKDMHEEVENDHVVAIDHDETAQIKHDRTHKVGNDDTLNVTNNGKTTIGQAFKLDAGTEIQLVCGQASITLKASGEIDIQGLNIKINGTATVKAEGGVSVDVKAGMGLNLQGTMVKVNADAMLTAQASGMATLKGAMATVQGEGMTQISGGILMLG